jgi:chaperonin GroES
LKVYVGVPHAEVDWRAAGAALSLLPGRVAVQMHPARERVGDVWLTDRQRVVMRPMVGTVLAVGSSDDPRNRISVNPGDVVICHPEDGKRLRGFRAGEFETSDEVRVFGIVAVHLGKPLRVPWHESVMGVLMDGTLYAAGRNVLVRLQEKSGRSAGGIVLPDRQQDRPDVAQVVSIGPSCADLSEIANVGDWVLYERRALKQLRVDGDESLALIDEDGIYGRVAT